MIGRYSMVYDYTHTFIANLSRKELIQSKLRPFSLDVWCDIKSRFVYILVFFWVRHLQCIICLFLFQTLEYTNN